MTIFKKRKRRQERKKRVLNAFLTDMGKKRMIALAQAEGLLPIAATVYKSEGRLKLNVPRIQITGSVESRKTGKSVPSRFQSQESSRRILLSLRRLDRKTLREYLKSIA